MIRSKPSITGELLDQPGPATYEPLISLPLVEAPLTLSEAICMPPAPLLVDAPLALKEVIYDGIDDLPKHFNIAADDAVGPFTPAQNSISDRQINAIVMKVLDPLIDVIIAKVVVLIE